MIWPLFKAKLDIRMSKAAIIIPHFNDTVRLRRCLEALSPQLSPDSEAIVVDNGSSEPVADVMADFRDVKFVVESEKGAAAARNRGVVETKAPYLFFLDADCVPNDDWLSTALALAGSQDLIGGRVDIFHEGDGPLTGAQAFEEVFAFDIKGYIETKGFTVTANLLTSREIFEKVGPFHPGVSEDLDWCHRARDAGFNLVYDDTLRVSHPSRNDWPALRKKWIRMTKEGFGLVEQTPLAKAKWALRGVAMLPSIFWHGPKVLFEANLQKDGGNLKGFATLARLRVTRFYWMIRQAMGLEIH